VEENPPAIRPGARWERLSARSRLATGAPPGRDRTRHGHPLTLAARQLIGKRPASSSSPSSPSIAIAARRAIFTDMPLSSSGTATFSAAVSRGFFAHSALCYVSAEYSTRDRVDDGRANG
jgi:hypothetical protein